MTETSRLRRLDALFAEKVLGYTLRVGDDFHMIDDNRYGGGGADGDDFSVPTYTRSLDAAWEGAMRIGKDSIAIARTEDDPILGKPPEFYAGIDVDSCSCAAFDAMADHPAEALVLACLKAVGVPESELA